MPLPYNKFRFFYPPRPDIALPAQALDDYETGEWMGQVKLNGSNTTYYTNHTENHPYQRHNQLLSNCKVDLRPYLPEGGWYGINGEYMNKGQNDIFGKKFSHKFVIFDLLVHKNKYLLGTTFEDRFKRLEDIFQPSEMYDPYIWKISEEIYMVKPIFKNFRELYDAITSIPMYEGFVLKKKTGKMESGLRPNNTSSEQFKFRKQTKNYAY